MKIAVVRVRGTFHIRHDIDHTLDTLGLRQKNHCIVVENTPQTMAMIKKIESFVTFGPVDEKNAAALKKKGAIARLNPPRKGYGRKGVKIAFSQGGALGDRKEKINDLLTRML